MENRNGFIVATRVTPPAGNAEREAAVRLASQLPGEHRKTLAGDKGFDTEDRVAGLRDIGLTPHVAQNDTNRRSAVDGRTTRHRGYLVSLKIRKLIETRLGWMKDIGTMRKTKHRGTRSVDEQFRLNATAFNLLRFANLLRASPA